jgi:DDE superfamily endonuclease/homeodomain-containing protein
VPDETVATSLAVGGSTVCRTERRLVEGGLERALDEGPRPGAARKLPGKEEALLVATACSSPPEGRARRTLELPAGEVVRLTERERVSRETVRRRLAGNAPEPWRRRMWCVPPVSGEHVARMEDVLDLHAAEPDPGRPVVRLDESPVRLIGEVRRPIPAAPGRAGRHDHECRRDGTVDLFVPLDARRPWREVEAGERRTAAGLAACMRELVDVDLPHAERIRVVLDDLSARSAGSLHEAFPAAEAHRILRRLEFHPTPEHAGWLSMAEIGIGVPRGRCLDRRTDHRERLEREIAARERERNAAGARVGRMFTTEKARAEMGRAYPGTAPPDPPAERS